MIGDFTDFTELLAWIKNRAPSHNITFILSVIRRKKSFLSIVSFLENILKKIAIEFL